MTSQLIKNFKMKRIITAIFLTSFCSSVVAQTSPKKIKIILLGTFHFNQSLDSTSKLHSNLFTEKRQKEVNQIVDKLVNQKPDKIFLEFTEKNQAFYDSIYLAYQKGNEPTRLKTKANEIFQLGMKVAKKLGHTKVFGMNYQPEDLTDTTYKPKNLVDKAIQDLYFALGNFNDSTRTNSKFYDLPYPQKLPKQDSLLQKSTLSEFLLFLNTEKKLQKAEYEEWNYFLSMGTGNDMSSTEYVGTFWYGTNLRNFNNVMRQVDYEKDKCYLIIYGSNHIPFLKYLFNQNPYFEVIEIDKVLK
jgi:hypothetical protein